MLHNYKRYLIALLALVGINSFADYASFNSGGASTWREITPTAGQLPSSGNVDGATRIAQDTKAIYVYDALTTSWLAVSSPAGNPLALTGINGDVSASGPGVGASTIQPNVVSNSKLAQMNAHTFKGNNTGATANASDLSIAQVKTELSLSNVDNTSDANKPVSTAQQTALDLKLDILANPTLNPNGLSGGFGYAQINPNVIPLQNSPDQSYNFNQLYVNIDPTSTGYTLGSNGGFGNLFNIGYSHQGKSNIGNASLFNTYSNFGNGTDPFTMKGYQVMYGFGNINSGVTVQDSIQGYGMQMNVDAGATMNGYFTGFYDNMTFNTPVGGYNSANFSPQLSNVKNNNQVTSININPTISAFTGNAGYNGVAVSGNFTLPAATTGGINGVSLNPVVSGNSTNYYNGIYSSTQNVTGISNKYAGYFDGDVSITGSLTFGGALSIGKLNAYGVQDPVVDGGGNPTTVHSLISQMNVPANATIANIDTLGVNTAALITVGANSTSTSGPLGMGLVALGLPAVLETHTGSSVDAIGGALFAISYSGTSTGGTVNQGYGGRFLAIPNGITTTNRWYGVWSQQPFGNVATDNWGLYIEDNEKNYIEGDLKIGGTDTLSQTHLGVEAVKTIGSAGGIQVMTSGAQPTCDAAHRGLMWNIEGGAGVADIFQICQKNAANAYVWTNH